MRITMFSVLALAFMICGSCLADNDSFRSIRLTMADQSTLLVNMDKSMFLGFNNDAITLKTDVFELSFPLEDVNGWNFSTEYSSESFGEEPGGMTAIGVVGRDSGNVQFEGNNIILSEIPAGSNVTLLDMKGCIVYADKISGNGTVSLDKLHGGVYILSINGNSIKIIVNR